MKPDRFKALINQYLDQRISHKDLQRLSWEISQNPAQRELFEEYCRLDRGVALALNSRWGIYRLWRYMPTAVAACLLLLSLGLSAYLFWGNWDSATMTLAKHQVPAASLSVTSSPEPSLEAPDGHRSYAIAEKQRRDPNCNLPVRFENLPVNSFKSEESFNFSASKVDAYQNLYY